MKVFPIVLLSCNILLFLAKLYVFVVLHLIEKFRLIVFQNFLSITFLTPMLLKIETNITLFLIVLKVIAQPAIACSKLTIETIEQGVKYVQS